MVEHGGVPQTIQVAVIGAGMAGLAAARELVSLGLSVAVFDEGLDPGGRARSSQLPIDTPRGPLPICEWVEQLADEVVRGGAKLFLESAVLGQFADRTLAVLRKDRVETVRADAVVYATGARTDGLLFSGWTRPQVITAEAARRLAVTDRVALGRRGVIVGYVDESLALARELVACGVDEVVIVRADHPVEDIPGAADCLAGRPEVMHDWVIREAHGGRLMTHVTLVHRQTGQVIQHPCDFVVLNHLVTPAIEGLQLAGARFVYELALGGWVPLYDRGLRTTVTGVYVAGSVTGVESPEVDLLSGLIAGLTVASDLTNTFKENGANPARTGPEVGIAGEVEALWDRIRAASPERKVQARERIFGAFAHANRSTEGNAWSRDGFHPYKAVAHVHRTSTRTVEPWVVVCRCEDNNLADIRTALRQGARSPDDVKRLTRCGMGLCQWRACRTLVSEVISETLGIPMDGVPFPNVRFPLRPVSLGLLTAGAVEDGTVRSVLSEVEDNV
ncbi:NAD(P)/FAD-dependent oxidoreductase [Alicyclobacillus macrosporangiidus]|uniref:NAD(P)/FAD-dependent oxidoreductase n=1 Tax=Alicyclobacillus macrosporangiidus TaxID=392015 RepID=UPI000497575B|nr:NAD(P)/FAD-dependent oxidoreductase [Alicyclobacillus macrosporangiidus]